jgi:hypothetical protein
LADDAELIRIQIRFTRTAVSANRTDGKNENMPLNTWWANSPTEHYWMETAHRSDMGGYLFGDHPGPNKSIPRRETISHVTPGDVVFHWDLAASALVGYSIADSTEATEAIQAAGQWRFALRDFVPFEQPVTLAQLRSIEEEVLQAQDSVAAVTKGAKYLPFERNRGTLRPSMGYLHKMPAAVADILAEFVAEEERPPAARAIDGESGAAGLGAGARRRVLDAALRIAVENHAVKRAIAYYSGPGVTIRELGKPYDLLVVSSKSTIHVEVKGSRSTVRAVELTRNEVKHGQEHTRTDLFVVDEIDCTQDSSQQPVTSGGRCRIWTDWTPHDQDLKPSRYDYKLPRGSVFV